MDYNIKQKTYELLKEYDSKSESGKFYFYFNIRGNVRIRGCATMSILLHRINIQASKHRAEEVLLRIFNYKYHKFIGGSGYFEPELICTRT